MNPDLKLAIRNHDDQFGKFLYQSFSVWNIPQRQTVFHGKNRIECELYMQQGTLLL